jgi:hypothetical protein
LSCLVGVIGAILLLGFAFVEMAETDSDVTESRAERIYLAEIKGESVRTVSWKDEVLAGYVNHRSSSGKVKRYQVVASKRGVFRIPATATFRVERGNGVYIETLSFIHSDCVGFDAKLAPVR